jgi:predicted Zn-dependent protease
LKKKLVFNGKILLKKGVNIMKKIISGLMVVVVALILIVYTNIKEAESYSTASVLESVWDEFGLFSFFIGEEAEDINPTTGEDLDPTIWIEMDETKSELELREYLEENLSKSDLNHYKIEIAQRSLQEVQ